MYEDINMNEYTFVDEEDLVDIDYESVSFIDFLKMANNSFNHDASFDIDMSIISDAVKNSPIKVLQRRAIKVGSLDMYEIWAGLQMKTCEYLVPVRFCALISEYNENMFPWKVSSPSQTVDLKSVIEALEKEEAGKWEDLLQ